MPWIDDEKPSKPIINAKPNNNFAIKYVGSKKIKGYAFFIGNSKANAICKKIILKETEEINLNELLNDLTTKVYIASISINNNLSELVEIK
jgi:hypothetical protein